MGSLFREKGSKFFWRKTKKIRRGKIGLSGLRLRAWMADAGKIGPEKYRENIFRTEQFAGSGNFVSGRDITTDSAGAALAANMVT